MRPPLKLALVLAFLFAVQAAVPGEAGSRSGNQGVYAYNGNTYIIRTQRQGETTYLRSYRLVGDQWEPFGATSMPTRLAQSRTPYRGTRTERIYTQGKLIGHSDVDLDNPFNTLLNKNLGFP